MRFESENLHFVTIIEEMEVTLPAIPDSAPGDQLPKLLAESPAVLQALELLNDQWVLPNAEGQRPEQAQVVWVSMGPYGEDFAIEHILIALPGQGLEDAFDVPVSAAFGVGHPPISVRLIQGTAATFEQLVPFAHAPAVLSEDTFAPTTGGVLWPSPSSLARRAPGPAEPPMLLTQFTDLGPQFAFQGDALTDGFITADDASVFNDADDEEDTLPLVRGRGRGRGRGSRGRAASGGARSTRSPRASAAAGPAAAEPAPSAPARPPASIFDEVRTAAREELSELSARVSRLGSGRQPSPPPGLLREPAPSFDPLFETSGSPPQSRGCLNAALEAQQLLRMGAGSPVLGVSAASTRPGALRSNTAESAAAAPSVGADVRRRVTLDPAAVSAPAARDAGLSATLERIAAALEAKGPVKASTDEELGGAGSLSEYLNLL